MNPVFENLLTRRSIRSFQQKPIAREALEQIVEAGTYAPSGNNRQTWQFTVIDSPEKIQEIAKAMGKALGAPNYNLYCPTAIILVSNDKDNHNGLADCSCALENIFLAAHALGIGSCWINQMKDAAQDPQVRAMLTELGVPENHIVWGTAALGYAAEIPAAKPRREGAVVWVK